MDGPVRVFSGFDWSSENYMLAERVDPQDRFVYNDKRLTGGVQYNFVKHASLDLSGGYAFDRYYFQGHGGFQVSGQNDRVDIGNGPFVALQLKARF